LRRLKTHLTHLSRNLQTRLRLRAASGVLTESIGDAFSANASARSVDVLQQGNRQIAVVADRLASAFMSPSWRTMAGASALVALGSCFLLFGPGPAATTKTSADSHVQELRAPDARAAAAAAMKAAPAPGEVRINALQTTVALLSPRPISGGGNSRLAAPVDDPPRSSEAPIASGSEHGTASERDGTPTQGDAGSLDARAAGGDAEAQYDYATELYQSGDTKGAVSWLEKSAKQGNAKAQLQLGSLYLKGAGVTRNIMQARKWLEMAANNGDALAMHDLAVLYSGGEGRKPDYARASDWFRRAAEQGVVDSMFNLGVAYVDGLGVEKDLIQAYAWFSLAASQGDAKAAQKRKEIGRFLDREELSEGKILTDSLKLAQRSR
jgi:localization factor PodJL